MRFALAALIFCLIPSTTKAKPYDPHGLSQQSAQPDRTSRARSVRDVRHAARHEDAGRQAQILGGRPAGCPRRFCGCVASIKLFGRIRADLNLASNWLRKFPRTSPAPMMAAARPGHVMVLLEHAGGDRWKVHDGNSGGGLTRIHIRSIRGFAVVNPHNERVAQVSQWQ
jgi:hypothetical protein